MHHDPSAHDRERRPPGAEGGAVTPLHCWVYVPRHQVGLHPGSEAAQPALGAGRVRGFEGIGPYHFLESESLLEAPAVTRPPVGRTTLHRGEDALARIDGGHRHVATEDDGRAALE